MSRQIKLNAIKTIHVVVLVLENGQGDILITQRKSNVHLADYWEFPGGKIEPNETASQALKRECLEELNYLVVAPKLILTINHDYPDFKVKLMVFHEHNSKPVIQSAENQALRWIKKSELLEVKLPAANQAILAYLCN